MDILVEETTRAEEIALSLDYLTKVLDCNSETDEFTWKISQSRNMKVGTRVGGVVNRTGYRLRLISMNNMRYKAGRLVWPVWLYHYGEWPSDETPPRIDRINGNRPDGRIADLRQVTDEQNSRSQKARSANMPDMPDMPNTPNTPNIINTPTPVPRHARPGVRSYKYKPRGKRIVVIRNNGKYECSGYYAKFEGVVKAREAAEMKYGYKVRKEG